MRRPDKFIDFAHGATYHLFPGAVRGVFFWRGVSGMISRVENK